ncbi:HNH endonuclease signature motif containing protein [Microbacterium sp. BK668]|uniref:HNH endonuclease signature motif containing protein n=1 Tax=Microbacterium sp. BK668 TaxID=2512118 RepID=UPI00105CC578|nr:HNH endonuclease signature motif containing protein [Microbacterium sp. BK668]TDN91386.1 uncharacterized protein DUF222 [Microbacterium sp. BK668]
MTSLAAALCDVERALGEALDSAFGASDLRRMNPDEIMAVLAAAAGVVRCAEAVLVATVAEVQERDDTAPYDDRPTRRHGCRSMKELVQRATRVSGRRVGELLCASRAVRQPVSPATGEVLGAAYPAMRSALADGEIGVDAVVTVAEALNSARCAADARLAADAELAASAVGSGEDRAPAPCADDLRLQARVWAMYLDQDGTEPRESRALRKRGFTIGVCRDGVVPARGDLLPEVAAQLQRLLDSVNNPKGDGPDVPAGPYFVEDDDSLAAAVDSRTRAMKQHDALAAILAMAARSGQLPTIGGAAPTLVVPVDGRDLAEGRGHAHIDGCDEPVSLAVARQVACTGAVQRVTTDARGRILSIDISDRVFAAHQRKAITLRDGGCIIPGCHVPAAWCEIHHVLEHSVGGPTHTDNGVLLCWYHHRTIDSSGWKVRMRGGVPEVRGPTWWDATGRWRPVTKSPTRLSRALRARAPSSGR